MRITIPTSNTPHPVRERIQARWFEIRKGKDREPERAEDYEALHHEFSQQTFATLYAVVHEFDEPRPSASATRRSERR